MMMYEGFKFFKPILGCKELGFLMTLIFVHIIFLISIEIFVYIQWYLEMLPLATFVLSAVAMVIYFCICQENIRSHIKTVKNLKKFQLFRFIYYMIALKFFVQGLIFFAFVRDT